jgi:hypothetical protein
MNLTNPLYRPLVLIGLCGIDEIPAAVRRHLTAIRCITAVLLFGGVLAFSVTVMVGKLTGRWIPGGWMIWPWVAVCPLWLMVAPNLGLRPFLNALREARYLVCLTCGQNLSGLPSSHKCPECGTAFDADVLQSQWKAWLRTIDRDCE